MTEVNGQWLLIVTNFKYLESTLLDSGTGGSLPNYTENIISCKNEATGEGQEHHTQLQVEADVIFCNLNIPKSL